MVYLVGPNPPNVSPVKKKIIKKKNQNNTQKPGYFVIIVYSQNYYSKADIMVNLLTQGSLNGKWH